MSRDPRVRLDDIVQYADEAIAFTAGMTYEAFVADVRTQRAVLYSLQVIGEAAKHVPGAVQARAPEVEWKRVMRFRDRAAHGYDSLDLDMVWAIVSHHLPVLRDRVASLIAAMDAGELPAE